MRTAAQEKTITLTEDALDPYVTHVPTRRWLTGPGLPGVGALVTFEALRRDGLRTVGDSTGDPGAALAADVRDQLVIGGLLSAQGRETESVLLDGSTGEVSSTYFLYDRPGLMDLRPLAPSLEKLVRFATAADELAALRGQFACYAGRFGPEAVAEASRQLLALYEAEADGEVPRYWRTAAVIRPLSLIAGPGTTSGLALDLPVRLLDEEYGHGAIVRFEEMDLPGALTHAPTRRFLTSVGLPEQATWFTLDTDAPLRTLAEYCEDEGVPYELVPSEASHFGPPVPEEMPFGSFEDKPFAVPPFEPHPSGTPADLIRLGALLENTSLLLNARTGAVLSWTQGEHTLRPLNADISTLAFTLWLIHRERTLNESHALTEVYDQLATAMSHTLASVDRTAVPPKPEELRYWQGAFGAFGAFAGGAGAALYA